MLNSDNLKCLLGLLADGQFHSGTELARVLAVSRTAVWKHLQAMSAWGVEVVGVSGKGYKLQHPLQLLDQNQIETGLRQQTRSLMQRMEIHTCLPSTNGYLLQISQQNQASGWVCLAEYQTAGKGRRGRQWISPFGHNIYLSLLWRYQNGPGAIAGLSLAIGVAVVRALRGAGVEDVGLKWPNDIYWRGRKLAGILIEVSGESSGPCHAVIGLGLNVYLPSGQAAGIEQAWVDLQQILGDGAISQRNSLVALLLNEMLPVIADFDNQDLPDHVNQWREFDCMRGGAVSLFIGQQRIDGIVRGVDDQGLLLLEDGDGRLRAFASGEVSFRAA
ncbi:bifunctional biotin--[acetyl-CoA-carboxylase] ligase/biotin operon repressor BirA [Methylomonas sp. LL1]|uniref:bifunctional biotin--[acetyl-CoA-carboxylase] ligase/biotin operon repressor BirA n=1 Tax=Methylomonas sp. LL1 TaxID=2785785 RepID=UPI0018C3E97A|nr:bifunctional biotin--[acetyl-CoA-carboxylase] ligase/biotin operon repressor BirA [Methylomonas sp. LL1]QPK64436.1 bifunctional biotin--[acetyl-CoA-carboxylase] ligase/biotin operon repressor BirA [Methylomonas sp. LL1]